LSPLINSVPGFQMNILVIVNTSFETQKEKEFESVVIIKNN